MDEYYCSPAHDRVTGGDGSLDYPLTRARVTPIIYFGVTTCHRRASTSRPRRLRKRTSSRSFAPNALSLGPPLGVIVLWRRLLCPNKLRIECDVSDGRRKIGGSSERTRA